MTMAKAQVQRLGELAASPKNDINAQENYMK